MLSEGLERVHREEVTFVETWEPRGDEENHVSVAVAHEDLEPEVGLQGREVDHIPSNSFAFCSCLSSPSSCKF